MNDSKAGPHGAKILFNIPRIRDIIEEANRDN